MTTTSAPARSNTGPARRWRRRWRASTTMRSPSSRRRSSATTGRGRRSRPRPRRRPADGPGSPTGGCSASSARSIAASTSSGSFVPPTANSLMPLSRYGLCDAEIIAPMRAEALRLEGDHRGRHDTEPVDDDALAGETGDEGGLEHRRRHAGVATETDGRRRCRRAPGPRPGRGRGRTTPSGRCWRRRGHRRCRTSSELVLDRKIRNRISAW